MDRRGGLFVGCLMALTLLLAGCSNSSTSSTTDPNQGLQSPASSAAHPTPSTSGSPSNSSWVPPAGFNGTVRGDSNIAWKVTKTSGDSAFDSKWCGPHFPPCYFFRIAVNEDCSSVSGTLQLINSLGEVEDTVQTSSAAGVTKGSTTTLVFEANNDTWNGNVKLSNLGCLP
jgi:hypothetical protein